MQNNILKIFNFSLFVFFSFCLNNSKPVKADDNIGPSGNIINGIRVIRLSEKQVNFSLYVYRGETVKLIFAKRDFKYSVNLPDFNISRDSDLNKELEIDLSVKTTGVFPVFCNGDCPVGDGMQVGKIIVMHYESGQDTLFKNLSAKQARDFIAKNKPFILDVRTPVEFYSGYIPGAKLIPVQQLADRISEVNAFKEKDVFVYCRSGNRSIVASEILEKNGFKRIYNLSSGIKGWLKQGYDIKK